MPNLYFQVPDVHNTVLQRVAFQMTQSVIKDLALNHLFDRDNVTVSSDILVDSNTSDGDGNIRLNESRCDVAITEITNPANLKWDVLNVSNLQSYGRSTQDRSDIIPLFRDPDCGIEIQEYLKPCNLRMEFTMRFRDKGDAMKAESAITNRYHASSIFNAHDLMYHYPLDKNLAACLFALFKLRTSLPADYHFVDYLRDRASQEFAFEVSNTINTDTHTHAERRLVIKKSMIQAIALLEYDQERPEPVTVQKATDRWDVRFTYTLQFSRPDGLRLGFPTVVENQWVPATVLPAAEPESHLFMKEMQGLMQQTSFNHAIRRLNKKEPVLIRMPFYEEFYPRSAGPTQSNKYRPFLISSFTLDDPGPTQIDLQNMGDVALHPTTIELMKAHGADLLGTAGLFNIAVYANGIPVDVNRLALDENLVISVNMSTLTKRYHIVLSETTELKHISGTYITLLLQYRWFFSLTILKQINTLLKSGALVDVPSGKFLELLTKLFKSGAITAYTQALIDAGHVTDEIWPMVTYPYQYAEYVTFKRSALDSSIVLFTALMELLEADALVSKPYPEPTIRTASGLPLILNMKERLNGPATPFRIGFARITTK